jgi:penicillin-binding protein 2
MLIFDQLKKDDPQLRLVAVAVLFCLGILLVGLWWVQVVSAGDYRASLETQSYRTVRIPSVRGKILDRNGVALAENRPTYNINLYLEELRSQFQAEYTRERPVKAVKNTGPFWRTWFGSSSVTTQYVRLKKDELEALKWRVRCHVASNVLAQIGQRLGQPIPFNPANFQRHYEKRLALPYPAFTDLTPLQIARFEEQSTSPMGVDLEVQFTRHYPFGTTAAHLLGHLKRDDDSREGEDAYFSFYLPDYRGLVGIEYAFDKELRGVAGAKSVLVNNAGYRQTENIWSPAEPGCNVLLTIDLRVQQAAEQALQNAKVADPHGAVVVMDVRTGDILAMASAPTFNPNWFIPSLSVADAARLSEQHSEKNRATQEQYMPGSVFKLVVGMAALEAGWNPEQVIHVEPNPADPSKGHVLVLGHTVKDTAPPGDYTFRKALKRSSNSYFVTCGLQAGPERIVHMGHLLHLGERTGFAETRQEVGGTFPTARQLSSGWTARNTANISIGQDPVWVTPLQVAVMISAIANGGTVLTPRLVDRLEALDPVSSTPSKILPPAEVRGKLGLSQRTLSVIYDAMLADTEDADGTGREVRKYAALPGLRICAKTGTAQVQDTHNVKTGQTTWFASFAPYGPPGSAEKPRYAVVVMVEDGVSGGTTCSPIAGKVYEALMERDRLGRPGDAPSVARKD